MYSPGDVVINDVHAHFLQFFAEVPGEMTRHIAYLWRLFVCGVWECANGITIQWVIAVAKRQKSRRAVAKGDNKTVIFIAHCKAAATSWLSGKPISAP